MRVSEQLWGGGKLRMRADENGKTGRDAKSK
jgi:hypothetical protein